MANIEEVNDLLKGVTLEMCHRKVVTDLSDQLEATLSHHQIGVRALSHLKRNNTRVFTTRTVLRLLSMPQLETLLSRSDEALFPMRDYKGIKPTDGRIAFKDSFNPEERKLLKVVARKRIERGETPPTREEMKAIHQKTPYEIGIWKAFKKEVNRKASLREVTLRRLSPYYKVVNRYLRTMRGLEAYYPIKVVGGRGNIRTERLPLEGGYWEFV